VQVPSISRFRHEGPEDRDEDARYDPEKDIERRADLGEIGKAITTRAKNVGVGLVPDRGRETGCATEHDCDGERPRVDSHCGCNFECDRGQKDGDSVVADQLGEERRHKIRDRERNRRSEATDSTGQPTGDKVGGTGRFHCSAEREHAENHIEDSPFDRSARLLDVEAAGNNNEDGGDQGQGGDR